MTTSPFVRPPAMAASSARWIVAQFGSSVDVTHTGPIDEIDLGSAIERLVAYPWRDGALEVSILGDARAEPCGVRIPAIGSETVYRRFVESGIADYARILIAIDLVSYNAIAGAVAAARRK